MLIRKSWSMVLVVSAALLAACGGGTGSGSASGAASPKAGDAVPGLSKLGHFSSADGMVHLVVDRTGEKAKIRIDGSKDVIELTHEEVRRRMGGDLMGYAFIAPDGKRMLFVGVGGDLTFIKDERDELPLVRDGEGVALGTPTIKGPPPGPKPKEKSPHDIAAEEMDAISVVKKLPQFKPEDSGDFTKVAQAYQLATADMFVHCGANCAAWYAPHPLSTGNGKGGLGFVDEKKLSQGPATEEEKKGPLAKYNAWLRPDYEFGDWSHQIVKSSWLAIFQLEFRQLKPKMPAIVWNVEQHDVIVVTPEGGRYWESSADNNGRPHFEKGIPPQAEWPAPLRNNLLFKEHVVELGKRGLVDKKLADEFQSIHEKWGECAKKVFSGAQKEIEANMTGPNHYYSASNRNNLVRRKYNDKAMAECGGKRAETIMAQILEKREADQKALFEKNKAKLASVAK